MNGINADHLIIDEAVELFAPATMPGRPNSRRRITRLVKRIRAKRRWLRVCETMVRGQLSSLTPPNRRWFTLSVKESLNE